ncbi:hypothetical protein TFLX_06370 [Thermoflexales bacterium]|nr:hypothetical protein TFLX_06370 [Thermoflexales bacterium]
MKSKTLKIALILTLVGWLVIVPLASAAPATQDEPPQIPSLIEFLRLLTTTVGVGMVVSFALAQLERFQNVSAQAKFWIVFAICMVLPLAAQALINLIPAPTITTLEPYWQAAAGGFTVFIGSQVFYTLVLKKKAASGS